MSILSHFQPRLSMMMLIGACTVSLGAAELSAAAKASNSRYFGRWTVDEARPVFTAKGREYKTIDVAPCGKDFCGVSVAANGKCGPTLFRFLSKRSNQERLQGHGKWGNAKKNVVIFSYDGTFELYLGDGYDFGDRSENMPKFHANYKSMGKARCQTR